MFFFAGRRRAKLLQMKLTREEREVMYRTAPLTARLPHDLLARHEGIVKVLLNEKSFEGADGLELTDGMKLCIAGQAALLQLREDADYYPGLDTILVYPEPFVVDHEHHDESGLVTQEETDLSGESWTRGVVILAWSDVQSEAANQNGYNVVLHEFAHQLDDQTGTADGTPLLPNGELAARWAVSFQKALEKHRGLAECDKHVLFDEDAAQSPTEFFATAMELFFEFPEDLVREYPKVYAVLREYLGVDPGEW